MNVTRSNLPTLLLLLSPSVAPFMATSAAAQEAGAPGAAPLVWPECRTGQVEVMILGTFHFAQASDVDVMEPARQSEIVEVLDRLEAYRPQRIAVEFPHARAGELSHAYREYLEQGADEPESPDEIAQIGFRLARRLGHDDVYAVDVPRNLWHDSIQVFDDRWPGSRAGLRARWPFRLGDPDIDLASLTIREALVRGNRDEIPANSEMYAGFLPLVEEEVYAGALKLRPWYDRNLRIVQNLFRIADPGDERLLLVIGWGHLRVLKQILEITPQMCPVSAITHLRP